MNVPPSAESPVPRPPLRVVVVDDQAIVREGLVGLLGLVGGIEVVGVAADGQEVVEVVGQLRGIDGLDVVLMDLRMPVMGGVQATATITAQWPDVAVLVLTTYRDDESIVGALAAGARGYLTKDVTAEELAHALSVVHSGGFVLGRDVRIPPAPRAMGGNPPTASVDPVVDRGADAVAGSLTARERDVLVRIAAGRTNAEIAAELFIGTATVKTHINNLFAKLDVRDRPGAMVWAYERNIGRW